VRPTVLGLGPESHPARSGCAAPAGCPDRRSWAAAAETAGRKRSLVEGDKRKEGAGVRSGSCHVGTFAGDAFGVVGPKQVGIAVIVGRKPSELEYRLTTGRRLDGELQAPFEPLRSASDEGETRPPIRAERADGSDGNGSTVGAPIDYLPAKTHARTRRGREPR
jgi:hypothetical protein